MTFDPQDPPDSQNEGKENNSKRESLEEMLGFQDFFGNEPENDPFAGEDPFAEADKPPLPAPEDEIMAEDLLRAGQPKRREDSFPWELPEFDSHAGNLDDEDGEEEISPAEPSTEVSAVSEVSEVSEISTEVSAVSKLPLETAGSSENTDGDLFPDGFGEIPTGVKSVPAAAGAMDEPTPVAQVPVEKLFSEDAFLEPENPSPGPESPAEPFRMDIEDIPDSEIYSKPAAPMEIEDVPDLDLYAPAARKTPKNPNSSEDAEELIEEDVVELVEEENLWITPPGSLLSNDQKTAAPAPPPLPVPPPLPAPAAASESSSRVDIEEPGRAYPEPDPSRLTDYGASLLAKTAEELRDRWLQHAEKTGTDAEKARFLHEAACLSETSGDAGTAIKLFARAVDLDPSLAPNLWHIRRFLFIKGMLDKVEPLLKLELEKSSPRESTFLHYWMGFIAECRGDGAKARDAYEEAIRENPNHLPSLLALWRQSAREGDLRGQLDLLARMEPLLNDQELRIAFTIYSAHILERTGDTLKAADRCDAIAASAGEWSPMVWQALERLRAGDFAALAETLEKEAFWMETAGMHALAVALHLEASVLRERDGASPQDAFAALESRGLEHPLVQARLLDLAWRCGNREYLAARHTDQRSFETLWAQAITGGPVEYDPARDNPDVLWLADALKPDPALHERVDPRTGAEKRAPLQLLCAYRAAGPEPLEACLNSKFAPAEAWWAAYWLALENGPEAARACLKRMQEQAADVYDAFFRREDIHLNLLESGDRTRALKLLEDGNPDAGRLLMAAEIALAGGDPASMEYFLGAAQAAFDPQTKLAALLQAARIAVQRGDVARARALLAEEAGELPQELEESACWLARMDHDFDFLLERLENSPHDADRLEAASYHARAGRPDDALRILDSVEGPQARWMRLETAIRKGDFEAVRELVPLLTADYPEDDAVVSVALGIWMRDRSGMDVSDILQAALTSGVVDRTLTLTVEREFAAAGRPRDIWREAAHADLPEDDELEKWVALAWDEQDPEAALQLEAFAQRTAGTAQRIAAVFARFVALRNRDPKAFLQALELSGPSLRLDFRRFWNSDPQSPAEGTFACATDPFHHAPEELRTFFGACLDAPETANWEALACEGTGRLGEAISRRRLTGFEIPSYLALSRIARTATDVTLLCDAEWRLAKYLPEGHPRRLTALERTAAAASLADRPQLVVQAAWMAHGDSPGEDALRRCIDYAIAGEDRECLRFFLIQAQYVIPDDERRQLAHDHLGEDGSGLLDTDPASAAIPQILLPENMMPPDAYEPPRMEDLQGEVPANYWTEDAQLLLELASMNADSRLYEEAAALFLLAGETAAAQGLLGDMEDTMAHALLQAVIAFRHRDAADFAALRGMKQRPGDPLRVALCELQLDEDGDFPPDPDPLPEIFEARIDLCVQRGDESGIGAILESTGDPLWRYILARSISDHEPARATDAYLKLLQGEMAIPALFQILRMAWRMEKAVFIKPALMRLSQLCQDPFVVLEKIRAGMEVSEIPAHPLVVLCAYWQGLVDAVTAAQHMRSAQLRLRLLTQAALAGNPDAAFALAELDPGGLEPELVRRMAAADAPPETLADSWGKVEGLSDTLRWWMGLPPAENAQRCMARIMDEVRARARWDESWRLLPEEMQEPLDTLGRLRFLHIPDGDFRIPAVDRLAAFALHEGSRLALLEEETRLNPDAVPAFFGLLLLDENREPDADCPWVLACHRREKAGMPAARAWEPAWQTPGIDWTLPAWRAAIIEELQESAPSTAWTMHAPPEATARVNRRWERRSGIPASLPFADAMDEVSLGMNFLHSLLSGTETIEYLQGESDPVLQELARRSMFRTGLWPDLARLYLERLESETDPARKAECFRQLIRIDSEGRMDMDSAVLTRHALAESYPQDVCNLLMLLEVDRENLNSEAELAWFGSLARQVRHLPEKNAFSMELWRLEYLFDRRLPDREAVAEALSADASDAALSWWAFCLIPDAFPFELAARLYDLRQESGMIFARRHAEQLAWDAAQSLWDELLQSWPAEIPLLNQCLKAAFSVGAGARCAQVLTLAAEDPLLSAEEKLECLYMAALADETWAENAESAIERYRRVLQEYPEHEDSFLRCRQILLRLDRPAELAALLQARIAVENRPGVRARLRVDLAELQLSVLMDRPSARQTYMSLAEEVPDWKPGLSKLAALHEEVSDFENAAAIMKQWLPLETDPVVRCSVCRRLGAAERTLGHAREALDWYIRSLELDPNQLDLWEHVVDLHLELSDPRKAAWALKKCIALQPKSAAKVDYLRRLSEIYENQIRDNRLARDALLEAVDVSNASLVAVESLVHFYDRHADSASRNIKLDLLWTAERQKVVKLDAVEPVVRIAHFAAWKQNIQAAQLLSECAEALGVKADLPAKPQTHPVEIDSLTSEEVCALLFPSDLSQGQRRMIQVVHEEACRQLKDVFKKSLPARSERLRQLPPALVSALGNLPKGMEAYRHSSLQFLPLDPPVLLVPASWNLEEIDEPQWRFLVGGHLFLHRMGLSIPLALNAEQMVHFLAALVQNVFPERQFAGMDAQLVQEYSRYASKIVGRKDRDLLAGSILEMGSFDRRELSEVQNALMRSADRAGCLHAGGFAPAMRSEKLLENGPERLLKLLQFVVSQTHVQLRETALVARMRV